MRNIQIALVVTNSLLIIMLCIGIAVLISYDSNIWRLQSFDNAPPESPLLEATLDALATSVKLREGPDLSEEQIETAVRATLESMGVGATE